MTTITVAGWTNPTTLNLPPYPQELVDFLAEDCPFWPGKKRSETHIVVPCFPRVQLEEGGEEVPLTLATLNALDKKAGGIGHSFESSYSFILEKIPQDVPAEDEFYWAVMTRGSIPGSKAKAYTVQQGLLPAKYEIPGLLNAARAILWELQRLKGQHTYICTRCEDVFDGARLTVESVPSHGLRVSFGFDLGPGAFGVAGWWKF